jgi:hypothetical protein
MDPQIIRLEDVGDLATALGNITPELTITPSPDSVLGQALAASAGGTKPEIEMPATADEAPLSIKPVYRIEQARALPEAGLDQDGIVFHHSDDPREILAFKDSDGRTMQVVLLPGIGLAKRVRIPVGLAVEVDPEEAARMHG